MADEFSFLDTSTGLPLDVGDADKEELFLQGKLGFKKGVEVPLFDTEEGKNVSLPSDKVGEAISSGRWKFLNDEQLAIDSARQEIRNEGLLDKVVGGAKRGVTQIVDEALGGIPETAADAYQGYKMFDPDTKKLTDYGRRTVEAEERPIVNLASGLAGFGVGAIYGAPLFKAFGAAGQATGKAAGKVAEKVISNKLAQSVVEKGAALAGEGVAMGTLPVGAKHIGAVLGDQETVAEAVIAGSQDLALFSALNTGGMTALKGLGAGLGMAGSAIKAANSPKAQEVLNNLADTHALKQYSLQTAQLRKLAKNEGKIGDAPSLLVRDLEDETGEELANILAEKGEKALNARILAGIRKYAPDVGDSIPRFQKAAATGEALEKSNERILGTRSNVVKEIDGAVPSGLVSETSALAPLKKLRDDLIKERGEGLAKNAGLSDIDEAIQSTADWFAAKRLARGTNEAVNVTFKEADQLRSLLGDFAYPKIPGMGLSKQAKSEAAAAAYATFRNSLINTVKSAETEGLIKKGLADKYLQSGKEISELMLYKDVMKSAAEVAGANAVVSPFDVITGAAAAGVGGLPAVALGTAGAFIKRQYGNILAEKTYRGLSSVIDNFGSKVDGAIDSMLSGGKSLSTAAKLGSVSLFDRYFDGDKKEKADAFNHLTSDLSRIQADPRLMTEASRAILKPILESDPQLAAVMQAKLAGAAGYLLSVAPKPANPTSPLMPQKFIPTDSQLSKFKRQAEAVFNPNSVLQDMEAGVATPDQFHALEAVYPKLFASIRDRAMDRMATTGAAPTYSKRMKLRYLLGEPMGLNISKPNIQSLQNNFLPSKDMVKPKANSKITESSRGQTDIERIIGN